MECRSPLSARTRWRGPSPNPSPQGGGECVASSMIASRSHPSATSSAARAIFFARSSCSSACTSPRWREGSAMDGIAPHEPEQRHGGARKPFADQIGVPLRRHLVDDRAGDGKSLRQPRAAFRHRRRRLRQALRADDEQHRQAGQRGERCGRAGAARPAVVEAHHAFDDDDVRARGDAARAARAAAPGDIAHGSRLIASPAARRARGTSGRCSRARISRRRPAGRATSAPRSGRCETSRLAGMARRRGDDQPARHARLARVSASREAERIGDEHAARRARRASRAPARSRTTSPTTTTAGGSSPLVVQDPPPPRRASSPAPAARPSSHARRWRPARPSPRPPRISDAAMCARCFTAMYMTMTGAPRATPSQSIDEGVRPLWSWPVRNVTEWLMSRCVTGMPA